MNYTAIPAGLDYNLVANPPPDPLFAETSHPAQFSTSSANSNFRPGHENNSFIERLPNEILLLCFQLLSFDDLLPTRKVSIRFRDLFISTLTSSPLPILHDLWYRDAQPDRFFSSQLDKPSRQQGQMTTGYRCHGTTNCWCANCTTFYHPDFPIPLKVHRLAEEFGLFQPWLEDQMQPLFNWETGSFLDDITPDSRDWMLDWSMFYPVVKDDLPFILEYKIYRPNDQLVDNDWKWPYDENDWQWPYEHLYAGGMVTVEAGQDFITVERFLVKVREMMTGPWRWMEEKFEITGINITPKISKFHQNSHLRNGLEVTVSLVTESINPKEEYFDREKQRYNIPKDMREYTPNESDNCGKEGDEDDDDDDSDDDDDTSSCGSSLVEDEYDLSYTEEEENEIEERRKAIWGEDPNIYLVKPVVFDAYRSRGL